MSWQYMPLHWGLVDLNITVDGKNPFSSAFPAIQGQGKIPITQGVGQTAKISSRGGVSNIRGRGRSKRSGGSGGVCG